MKLSLALSIKFYPNTWGSRNTISKSLYHFRSFCGAQGRLSYPPIFSTILVQSSPPPLPPNSLFNRNIYKVTMFLNFLSRRITVSCLGLATPGTRKPGLPAFFQTRKPGFLEAVKPGFFGFIFCHISVVYASKFMH